MDYLLNQIKELAEKGYEVVVLNLIINGLSSKLMEAKNKAKYILEF